MSEIIDSLNIELNKLTENAITALNVLVARQPERMVVFGKEFLSMPDPIGAGMTGTCAKVYVEELRDGCVKVSLYEDPIDFCRLSLNDLLWLLVKAEDETCPGVTKRAK